MAGEFDFPDQNPLDDELELLERRIRQKQQQAQMQQSGAQMGTGQRILLGALSGITGGMSGRPGNEMYDRVMQQRQTEAQNQARMKALEDQSVMKALMGVAQLRAKQRDRAEDRAARRDELGLRMKLALDNQLNILAAQGANAQTLARLRQSGEQSIRQMDQQFKASEAQRQRDFLNQQQDKKFQNERELLPIKSAAEQEKVARIEAIKGEFAERLLKNKGDVERTMREMEQKFRSSEAEKQRQFQGGENAKNRALQEKALGIKANAAKTKAQQKPMADESKLRKELSGTKAAKDMQDVVAAYERVKQAAKFDSPAGDLALIFNFMKMLDPGSTVREGEFANAQNAGSIPERIRAAYNRAINGERLTADQRADFLMQSGNQYNAQLNAYQQQLDYYGGLAKQQGMNPANVGPSYEPAGGPKKPAITREQAIEELKRRGRL